MEMSYTHTFAFKLDVDFVPGLYLKWFGIEMSVEMSEVGILYRLYGSLCEA